MNAGKTPASGLFVTGTDTGVGKTFVGCALLRAWRGQGVDPMPCKPVESGCEAGPQGLRAADGETLTAAAGLPVDATAHVTPWRFADALAPDQAARNAGQPLYLAQLLEACEAQRGHARGPLLVEGAGGFYSPLAEDALNADLAEALGLPVLLVAEDRLGTLNACLLTVEALRHRGLTLAGLVLNRRRADTDPRLDNASALRARLDAPVVELPEGVDPEAAGQRVSTSIASGITPPPSSGASPASGRSSSSAS